MVIADSDDVFDLLFVFMEKSNNKDDEEVMFLDIKQNLTNYSLKRLRGSAGVLIDSLCELTN